MKKLLIVAVLCLSGCQVYMSKDFAADLKATTEAVGVLNDLCRDGDPNACSDGLDAVTGYLNALNGTVNGRTP